MNPATSRFSRHACLTPLAAFALIASTSALVAEAAPQVTFDVVPVVACRDVSTDEFLTAYPDDRLVEFRVQVSSLFRGGDESDLVEFFYRFDSVNHSIRVVDYAPQTTLEGETAGNVSIEDKQESSNHAGLAVTAPFDWPVKVTGTGDLGGKENRSVRYELAPKMTPVAASGTIRRGYGVYFKLKPSRATSLEGSKEFRVTLRVPATWRGGRLLLSCTATGMQRGVVRPLNETLRCGARQFNMALFLEGDAEAQAAAERMTQAEQELLNSISSHRREIERQFYPTLAHKVGLFLDVIGPPVPEDWIAQLVFGPSTEQADSIARHMPEPVRSAANDYAVARRQLSQLGPGPTTEIK